MLCRAVIDTNCYSVSSCKLLYQLIIVYGRVIPTHPPHPDYGMHRSAFVCGLAARCRTSRSGRCLGMPGSSPTSGFDWIAIAASLAGISPPLFVNRLHVSCFDSSHIITFKCFSDTDRSNTHPSSHRHTMFVSAVYNRPRESRDFGCPTTSPQNSSLPCMMHDRHWAVIGGSAATKDD